MERGRGGRKGGNRSKAQMTVRLRKKKRDESGRSSVEDDQGTVYDDDDSHDEAKQNEAQEPKLGRDADADG